MGTTGHTQRLDGAFFESLNYLLRIKQRNATTSYPSGRDSIIVIELHVSSFNYSIMQRLVRMDNL